MFQPAGIFAAMLTPFDSNKCIHQPTIQQMVEFFIGKGIDGIFPVSNVGQFIHVPEDDKRDFVDTVIETARGRVKVTPGISSPNARQSIEFGKYCFRAGADAVVLSAPYYFKYPPEVVEEFLATVAKGLDMPVILYNVPFYANEISIESLRRLLEIDTIVAIKESSGSLANVQTILNLVEDIRPDFHVMVGWEEMLLAVLTSGAHGCMVASGGILPELMTAIYRHYQAGEIAEAARIQRLVVRATGQMKKVFFPYGYQMGMQARGFDMGPSILDIPVAYATQLAQQQKIIEATIAAVLQEAEHPEG